MAVVTLVHCLAFFQPVARVAQRASPAMLVPRGSEAVPQAVGEWTMLSGPFIGARVAMAADGSVGYVSPSGSKLWRGERWEATKGSDSLLVTLVSTKSGDRLQFAGDVGPGGEEGSLAFSGRVSRARAAGSAGVSRWDFAKALAWGDADDREEDVGPFVFLRKGA